VADTNGRARFRVVVVDDNPDAAEALARVLEMVGHEVMFITDPFDTMPLVEGFKPRMVFLDLGMPGLDGFVLAKTLKAKYPYAQMGLVAVTGYGALADIAKSEAAGFDAHLTKPASVDAIQALIGKLARTGG
jgi:CheY-like chemotaxis protein